MRAVIYTRVSADRAHGRSVREQEADTRAVCEREGWTIIAVHTDNDRGASRHSRRKRPAWDQLVTAIEAGAVDVLVTWEASRATRDLDVYLQLRELCRRHSVQWSYNGRLYDLSRSDDAFANGLDMLIAEREAEQTRERVLRAVRANAEAGRPHGKLLYGYRREYDLTSGQLVAQVPRDDQADVVREVTRRVIAGESCYSIACRLNDRGVSAPRGGTWDLTQIRRVATNPGYAGKRVHQGRVVGGAAWPAIVDELTHHRAVARLSDPARRTGGSKAVRHLLTGVARCGICDAPVRLMSNRGIPSYTCSANFHVVRKQTWVDEVVVTAVLNRLAQPDAIDLFTPNDTAARDALTEAAEKRARLNAFYDAAAAGELTPAALARVEARLLPEIETAERRASRSRSPALRNLPGPDPATRWQQLTVPQRREVVITLLEVRIDKAAVKGSQTFDPATVRLTWQTA